MYLCLFSDYQLFVFLSCTKQNLDRLLHKGSTGDAKMLAYKVGVSHSTLFNLFEELKEIGADIGYDSQNYTYYYKKEIKIVFAVGREVDNYLLMSDLKKNIWRN